MAGCWDGRWGESNTKKDREQRSKEGGCKPKIGFRLYSVS